MPDRCSHREVPPAALRRGFTLVELLVVLAVIGLLLALLLPAVQSAREAARRMQCQNNLRQIGVAFHNYHDQVGGLPFGWDTHGTGWSALILPQLEQQTLYDRLIFAESANWVRRSESRCGRDVAPRVPLSQHGPAGTRR